MESNLRRGSIVRVLALAAASFAIAGLAGCDADRGRPSGDAAPAAERARRAAPEAGARPGEPGARRPGEAPADQDEPELLGVPAEPGSGTQPGGPSAPPPADVPAAGPTQDDVRIFNETMAWAHAQRLDTLPIGEIMVRIGRRFVGAPYRPGLLEVPGPERLVVNLREYDCVTFVETVLALSRMVRAGQDDFETFQRELARIRYRGGVIDGYPSRLHYFSEWIADNEAKGILNDITRELGGVADTEPIDFMSRNADRYPKLADPANLEAIREIERRLSGGTRYVIPEDRIADVAPRIRNGDIIAATSSARGLDVAHTGLAVWIDGRLHLMHAPLVGRNVEISELPLAERIRGIRGQDGIMVARAR